VYPTQFVELRYVKDRDLPSRIRTPEYKRLEIVLGLIIEEVNLAQENFFDHGGVSRQP
jgi:hypothetical protein